MSTERPAKHRIHSWLHCCPPCSTQSFEYCINTGLHTVDQTPPTAAEQSMMAPFSAILSPV
jgi:hypothetical protein